MEANASLRFKPSTNVQLTLSPAYNYSDSRAAYVRQFTDATATAMFGRRAVFAELEQHTLSMSTRLNWTFSPTLSLELYAQPFVAAGDYRNFKEFERPRSLDLRTFTDAELSVASTRADGSPATYRLDTDGDPAADQGFRFGNPDFNVRSLRGNAVLRWEYRPGSTLFLVWQQQRSDGQAYGDFEFGRDANGIFDSSPDNVLVVKATYWIGR